jgi:thioredoxin reductase
MYDCIVIGAGPAGLSASLFLARYRHRVLTFHNSSPRNLYSHGVHGFLGHDGILPAELLARGRDEVTKYGGLIIEACVTDVVQVEPEVFKVTVAGQDDAEDRFFMGRRLIIATGLKDVTPDCPGFREFYGRSVFHCPDCDGYEVSGKRVAVMGRGKATAGFTMGLMTWAASLTVITNTSSDDGDMTPEIRERLAALNIPIVEKAVTALEGDTEAGALQHICFDDGGRMEADALFFNLGTFAATDFHLRLGCSLDPECDLIAIDDTQQTSVPGVYAAGDISPRSQLAVVAAAEGAMAAIHVHKSLVPEERRM